MRLSRTGGGASAPPLTFIEVKSAVRTFEANQHLMKNPGEALARLHLLADCVDTSTCMRMLEANDNAALESGGQARSIDG